MTNIVKNKCNTIRIDQNITHFIDKIEDNFGEDTKLVVCLLFYFSKQHQQNLFSVNYLDSADFAKTFGYTTNYLRSLHPAPYMLNRLSEAQKRNYYKAQEENPNSSENRIFDSYLENALYLLLSRNMVFPHKAKFYKNEHGDEIKESTLESICFLKKLKTIWIKSPRGKEKIFYEYELHESFLNNINCYFVNINIDCIKKNKYYRLYLYLVNLETTFFLQNRTIGTSSFSFLCRLAGINDKYPKYRKNKLIKAFDYLNVNTNLKFKYTWVKNAGEKFNYRPQIEFISFSSQTNISEKAQKINILYTNFLLEVSSSFKILHSYFVYKDNPHLQEIMFDFLKDKTLNEVKDMYMKAQIRTFKKYNDKTGEKFNIFYRKLISTTNWNDIKNLFTPKEKPYKEVIRERIKQIEESTQSTLEIKAKIKLMFQKDFSIVYDCTSESTLSNKDVLKDIKSYFRYQYKATYYFCKN